MSGLLTAEPPADDKGIVGATGHMSGDTDRATGTGDRHDPSHVYGQAGLLFRRGERLLWSVSPIVDESLMGLVWRSANANYHDTTASVMTVAGAPHINMFDLAVNAKVGTQCLAYVLRQPDEAIASRRHEPIGKRAGAMTVDFYGARLPGDDLLWRHRRISPAALDRSPHHRALANHGLLPFDHSTHQYLIDKCPACAMPLDYYRSREAVLCNNQECRFDLRGAPSGSLDPRLASEAAAAASLLDPDPRVHEKALIALPGLFQSVDRGVLFELIWRVGSIGRRGPKTDRRRRRALPREEIVETLSAGRTVLESWPASLDEQVRTALADGGGDAAIEVIAAQRQIGRIHLGWEEHTEILKRDAPQTIGLSKKRLRSLMQDSLDGAEATQFLKTSQEVFGRLQRGAHLAALVVTGDVKRHMVFSQAQLEDLAVRIDGRIQATAASERIGITFNGVEQLILLGLLDRISGADVEAAFKGMQIHGPSLTRLLADLERSSDQSLVGSTNLVPLRTAVSIVGGCDKPWGTIIKAVLNGTLRQSTTPGTAPWTTRARIRISDRASLREYKSPTAAPSRPFVTDMTRRDVEGLLNISCRIMTAIAGTELAQCRSGTRFDRAAILIIAEKYITVTEILARWGVKRKLPKELKNLLRLPLLGRTAYPRSEVEALMGEMGSAIEYDRPV